MLHAFSSASFYCTPISGLKRYVLLTVLDTSFFSISIYSWNQYSPLHVAYED